MKRILVWGASGHGKVVAEAAKGAGLEVLGFCDDDPKKRGAILAGLKVSAIGIEEVVQCCIANGLGIAFGVGGNLSRKVLFEKLDVAEIEVVTVIHPAAVISESVNFGRGVVAFAGVVVNADSVVGHGAILNTSCSVDHECHIHSFAHLSPGTHLGGAVSVGEGTHIGIGASVKNNVNLGKWSIIGAGAAVVKDLPDRVVAVGVPARILRKIES